MLYYHALLKAQLKAPVPKSFTSLLKKYFTTVTQQSIFQDEALPVCQQRIHISELGNLGRIRQHLILLKNQVPNI